MYRKKSNPIRGYKALRSNMCAINGDGMQYELGKTYSLKCDTLKNTIVYSARGFHFATDLYLLFELYNFDINDVKFFEVEAYGIIDQHNVNTSLMASSNITLVRELDTIEVAAILAHEFALMESYSNYRYIPAEAVALIIREKGPRAIDMYLSDEYPLGVSLSNTALLTAVAECGRECDIDFVAKNIGVLDYAVAFSAIYNYGHKFIEAMFKKIGIKKLKKQYVTREYKELCIYAAICGDPNDLDIIVNNCKVEKALSIALKHNRPQDFDVLVHCVYEDIRVEIAQRGRMQDLDILVNDDDECVRAEVAAHGRDKDLDILVHDDYEIVKLEVLKHGRPQDLNILINDPDRDIKYEAMKKMGLEQNDLKCIMRDPEYSFTEALDAFMELRHIRNTSQEDF